MIKWIRESNLIENVDRHIDDLRCELAWEELQERHWTMDTVLWLHKQIMLRRLGLDMAGKIRRHNVQVGSRVCPPWNEVGNRLHEWAHHGAARGIDEDDIRGFHVRFEHIHPFADGNGRTGRMLMNWQRVRCGFKPLCILASEREKYYQWFREGDL